MCMNNGSTFRALIEKAIAFGISAAIIGFVVMGVVSMCVPSVGIA
jgi:hypothetical protein